MDSQTINTQIEQLGQKQHIEDISLVQEGHYRLIYSPQLTDSPYSHLTFTLNLFLPESYPEEPPRLSFAQKVYHLNVEPSSGEIHIAVLADDWSPFLTLAAVIDSLDSLLEEPDRQYPATRALLDQYINQPENYLQAIEKTIQEANAFQVLAQEDSVVQHVENITESPQKQYVLTHSFASQHNEAQLFKDSSGLSEIQKNKRPIIVISEPQRAQQIKVETLNDSYYQLKLEEPNNRTREHKKNGQREQQLHSLQAVSAKKVESLRGANVKKPARKVELTEVVKSGDKREETQSSNFEAVHLNLQRADRMLELLMTEHSAMEDTIKRSPKGRLQQKLVQKQERILAMIQQTLELSSSLREKLFSQLKTDTNQLLR